MTPAQLARNSAAGKACLAKHGREFYAALGRKGGSKHKAIVFDAPQQKRKEGSPAGLKEMMEALKNKRNLALGGLPIARKHLGLPALTGGRP